ncbi:MAG: type I methionyl aminopeptidase [Brachybacterium sp.]|nr:type I methionyl aminopeptidase [Brachybacterium sp.]
MKGFRRERIELKTPEQLVLMRRSGLLLAAVHDMLAEQLRPGISTGELDALAEAMIRDHGALPNFKGYHGFPATVCISVNEEIVHGIPGERTLAEGDVVSIDGGCIIEGWHSDAARTHIVGAPRRDADVSLLRITESALWAGIAAFASARRVGEIGAAIEDHVEAEAGETLHHLEGFGGHGIGSAMHQPPDVMNYRTRDRGPVIKPGMALAIEPMLIQGDGAWRLLEDDWTVVATRGGRAAHAEHSVAMTEQGPLVLTASDGGRERLGALGVQVAPDIVATGE